MPSPFIPDQKDFITRKCAKLFEQVNGSKASKPCYIKYLSYVIIPEAYITIFRYANDHINNDEAEKYLIANYNCVLSDTDDSDIFL